MIARRVLSAAGSALALAGLFYIGHRLFELAPERLPLSPRLLGGLLLATVVYAAAQLLLAQAWQRILSELGIRPSRAWVLVSYSDYQAAKYIPGNIANIIGRQVHGHRQGYPAGVIGWSTALELGGMVFCGAVFWLVMLLMRGHGSPVPALAAGVACFGGACLVLAWLKVPRVCTALALQMTFLLVSGGLFAGLVWQVTGGLSIPGFVSLVMLVSTFNAAWLMGMVTPGAPAGVGVRDGLLLAWASSVVPSEPLLIAILLSRMSTVLGDLLFWIAVRISKMKKLGPFVDPIV
jgi:glycosyltransferase 2 family protein